VDARRSLKRYKKRIPALLLAIAEEQNKQIKPSERGTIMAFSPNWGKDAVERAVSTFAQAALSVLGLEALDVFHADWKAAVGVGVGGAVLSFLKSLAAASVTDNGTASLVKDL
jgi:hypothetical protein